MESRNLPFEADIGNVLGKQDLSAYTLSMSHILDLSYASFAALRLPAALAAVVLLMAPLTSFILRVFRRHYSATWVLGAGFAVFLVAAHIALGRFGPYLSSKQLAQEIEVRARPQDKVMIYGDQAFGSSLLFYLRRPIDLVGGAYDFDVVRFDFCRCAQNLFEQRGFAAGLGGQWTSVPVHPSVRKGKSRCTFAGKVCYRGAVREIRVQ